MSTRTSSRKRKGTAVLGSEELVPNTPKGASRGSHKMEQILSPKTVASFKIPRKNSGKSSLNEDNTTAGATAVNQNHKQQDLSHSVQDGVTRLQNTQQIVGNSTSKEDTCSKTKKSPDAEKRPASSCNGKKHRAASAQKKNSSTSQSTKLESKSPTFVPPEKNSRRAKSASKPKSPSSVPSKKASRKTKLASKPERCDEENSTDSAKIPKNKKQTSKSNTEVELSNLEATESTTVRSKRRRSVAAVGNTEDVSITAVKEVTIYFCSV